MKEVEAVKLLEKLLDELRDQGSDCLIDVKSGLDLSIEYLESGLTAREFIAEQNS